MKLHKNNGGKHTISQLTDDNLAEIYYHLPPNHATRNLIRQHLIDCVTDEQLEDSGVDNPCDYITNWLGGEFDETRAVIPNPLKTVADYEKSNVS